MEFRAPRSWLVLVGQVQRWRDHRGSYRPAGEPINTRSYEVALISGDNEAKAFVNQHHYSQSYPALTAVAHEHLGCESFCGQRVERDDHLAQERLTASATTRRSESPGLGGAWTSRSSPMITGPSVLRARSSAGGVGASPWSFPSTYGVYLGRSKAERRRLLPDGTVLHGRALAKIRKRDRGWRYAAGLLERHGAEPLIDVEDPEAWLARWLPMLTRPMRHDGNLKYAWDLQRGGRRRRLPASLPYPKL